MRDEPAMCYRFFKHTFGGNVSYVFKPPPTILFLLVFTHG